MPARRTSACQDFDVLKCLLATLLRASATDCGRGRGKGQRGIKFLVCWLHKNLEISFNYGAYDGGR